MKDQGTRPTLLSFLASSGIPPEVFLQAIDILRQEVAASVSARGSESPLAREPSPRVEGTENEAIRRILSDISARWKAEDKARREERKEAPPPIVPPAGGGPGEIRVETVVLKDAPPKPGTGTVPKPPPPASYPDDMATVILRPGPVPPEARKPAPEDSFPAGTPGPERLESPSGQEEEDDVAKTVILRPDRLKGKERPKGGTQ